MGDHIVVRPALATLRVRVGGFGADQIDRPDALHIGRAGTFVTERYGHAASPILSREARAARCPALWLLDADSAEIAIRSIDHLRSLASGRPCKSIERMRSFAPQRETTSIPFILMRPGVARADEGCVVNCH